MYTIPQVLPWVELIGEDGSVSRYDNYRKFIESTSYWFVRDHLVLSFKNRAIRGFLYWGEDPRELYILRDQFGSVFSPSEILNDIKEYNFENLKKFSVTYNRYNYDFRYDPVAYTGKKHKGHIFRHPHTSQERRCGYAYSRYVRPNRRPNALPNSWDDYLRSDLYYNKSWKNKKKTKQWM